MRLLDRIRIMDWPLLIILFLLLASLVAWAVGWFVYPFGLLVLSSVLLARILQLAARKRQ